MSSSVYEKFEKAVYNLLYNKPFYAGFILNSRIMWDAYKVPTAGAAIINFTPHLIFNSEFMKDKTDVEFRAIMEHEVMHLLFSHMKCSEFEANPQIANIAQDCAINQYIEGLPSGCITVNSLEQATGEKLLTFQDYQYYYEKLIKHKDKLKSISTLDEHQIEGVQKASDAETRAAIKNTINEAIKTAAGNVPKHLKGIIDALNKGETIPWQQVLKNFIATSVSVIHQNTRKKSHRRFDLDAPGRKKKRELILAVCADSSGSVSNELFASFLNEVNEIAKNAAIVYFIDADCEVQNVEVIKKGKKVEFNRTGHGGTAYQPAIDKALELKANCIIYMGDGDCADTPKNPGVPFLWAFPNENIKRPGEFGKVLVINE